jgi:DNA-binding NarL/FixJ family response regulator
MRKTRASMESVPCLAPAGATVLVMSQHEGVRQQLVAYLGHSLSLRVSGALFSLEEILRVCPDVVVLDLSRLDRGGLRTAIDGARQVRAHLIALASIRDLDDERAVTGAGGLYLLKSAGADGLVEIVKHAAVTRESTSRTRTVTGGCAALNAVDGCAY